MKPSKHRLIRTLFAIALVAFVIIGGLGPMLIENGGLYQRSGYAEAGNRHIVHIASPAMLFDRPLLIAERATVSMAPPHSGRALSDAEIAVKLQDGSADLVIDDAKFLLDATGLHPARIATISDTVKPILDSITDLSFATLSVRDAKLMSRSASGGEPALLGHVTCDLSKPAQGQLHIAGTFERNGISIPFEVTLHTKNARSASGRLPLSAKISSDLITASLVGEFVRADDFTLNATQATVTAPHARDVIRWISDTPISGHGLEDFRAAGPLEWTGQTVNFQGAKFTIDGNQASGGLSVSVAGQRPMLDGTLAFENLELAPYVQPPSGALTGLTQNALDWSRWLVGEPTSGSLIRDLDADLRLSATSVTSGGATLGRGAASITIKDAKLLADLAEIDLDQDTQGSARVSIDLSGPSGRYELHGMLEAPDLANVTHILTDRQIVSGPGRVTADFTASGSTQQELHTSLAGTATLTMPDGGHVAFDLASLMANAKAGGGVGWDKVISGSTSLSSLEAKMKAANGVLATSGVQAQTDTRNIEIDGTVDLPNRQVDLMIAASPKDPANAGDVTGERVRIRGSLLAPAVKAELPSKAALNLPTP